MARLLHFLDRVIEGGIIAVLVFTPLAFGAVEPWARSTGQILILTLVTAWIVKTIWAPSRAYARSRCGTILQGRVQLSGLEWPGLVFAAIVLVQLVPLPPGLIQRVSPKTAEIFAASLPGYGGAGDPSFAGLPQWLQEQAQPEAGGVPVFAPDPDPGAAAAAMPAEWFDVEYSEWRPISLTPAHTRRALGVFLAHLAFFIVVFNQIERKAGLKRYLVVLAGLAGILSILGILQSLTTENKLYWWRGGGANSFGPFANGNNFAGWMEMALPIAAGLTLLVWRKHLRRRLHAPAVLMFAFFTTLGMTGFVLAKSRGGFVSLLGALAIVLVVFAIVRGLRPRTIAGMLVPVLLALAMAAWMDWPALRDRYGTLTDVTQETSFRDRLAFSRVTLQMAADFPVLGTGLGTFREAYDLYTPGTASSVLAQAHNDYAQVASESGTVGVLAVLWGLGLLLSRGVIGGLVRRDRSSRWFVVPAAIGVLALLLHSFVEFNLQIYSNSLLFVFLCAVLMRCRADVAARAAARNA